MLGAKWILRGKTPSVRQNRFIVVLSIMMVVDVIIVLLIFKENL